MHIMLRGAVLLGALALAAPAAAADRNVTISAATPSNAFTSADGSGVNATNQTDGAPKNPAPYTCSKDPNSYCDSALVHVLLSDVGGGNLKVRLEGFQAYSDYDLRVYDWDGTAASNRRTPTGDPFDPALDTPIGDPRATSAGDFETTNVDLAGFVDQAGNVDAYFLVEVPYFTVVNDHYTLKIDLTSTLPFEPASEEE